MPGFSAVRRRVANLTHRVLQAVKTEVYAFWRRRDVRPRMVLYESFAGNGMLCNPEAIFRALLREPEFAGFTHVWVLASKTNVLSDDPILWFAMMLMPCGPPAMKLTALADVSGAGDEEKMSIAKFLTVSGYIPALFVVRAV